MSRRTPVPDTRPKRPLAEAKRIARARNENLGPIAEKLDGYQKAFSGFSDEEVAILDGVILEPARPGNRG